VKTWCIPPTAHADFVYHLEAVLWGYQWPYDRRYPVICMDEASKQLLGAVNASLPLRAGRVRCEDYEYERKGVGHQFMCCEPRRGWRHVRVTARRTKRDWAEGIRALIDGHYPEATRMRLVLDNLNTHTGAPCTRRFRRRKPDGCWTAWRSITSPSTPGGSTWRKSPLAFYRVKASSADWTTPIGGAVKSVPGKNDATNNKSKSIGVFPSPSPGINSKTLSGH
jgi:hypothetical protein